MIALLQRDVTEITDGARPDAPRAITFDFLTQCQALFEERPRFRDNTCIEGCHAEFV